MMSSKTDKCPFASRPSRRRRMAAIVAGATLALASVSSAFAESPDPDTTGNLTGANVPKSSSAAPLTAAEKQLVNLKLASAVAAGILTESQAKAFGAQQGLVPAVAVPKVPTLKPVASSRILPVTHQSQKNSYYCGPASGAIIASYHNFTKSKYDGSSLSQDAMANNNHMKTAANKVTDWGTKLFVIGLNRWTGWTGFMSMVQVNAPSTNFTKGAFVWRVGYMGSPVAADTVEFANGAHYNKHPANKTIGHWIVGHGYSSLGATLYWTDPAVPTIFTQGSKQFSQSATSFNQFLASNGIAW